MWMKLDLLKYKQYLTTMDCFSEHGGGAHKLLSLCLDIQCPAQELYCLTKKIQTRTSAEPQARVSPGDEVCEIMVLLLNMSCIGLL